MSVEDRIELPSYLHHTPAVSERFAEIRKRPVVMSLSAVSRQFESAEGPVLALSKVSFDVRQREFISVIGPSGCGKSTLIRIVAGLRPVRWERPPMVSRPSSDSVVGACASAGGGVMLGS